MEKKRKLSVIGLAGLLVVAIVAGTFAYWNSTSTIENPFDTGKYGTTINEFFDPSDGEDWQAGVEVSKDVFVENTGDQDVIVRVKLEESWTRSGEATPYKNSADAANGYDVYTVDQDNATDGLTAADLSVVSKDLMNVFDAVGNTAGTWVDGGDGWYYYITNLKGGEMTEKWLNSVTLKSDADMGAFGTTYYVTYDTEYANSNTPSKDSDLAWYAYHTGAVGADQPAVPLYFVAPAAAGDAPEFFYTEEAVEKAGYTMADVTVVNRNKADTTYKLDSNDAPLYGYSNSDYSLTVTAQTVQATQDAIDAIFGDGASFTVPADCDWELK